MTRWRKPEVRRLFADAVTAVVSPAGFRFNKRTSKAFVRKIEGGRQELRFHLVDFNPAFVFSFALGIRLEAVQEIINQFGYILRFYPTTLTSLTQLEFLGWPGPGHFRLRVTSDAELAASVPGFLTMVRDRVLPFFDEYRDLAAVNRGLNPEGAERVFRAVSDWRAFDASQHPHRAMSGVAVAHLAQDPRFEALVRAYRRQMRELHEDSRSMFEKLVNYLSSERRLTDG
jgi:hypothetical protein